jgi:hypothetical protein
LHFKGAPIEHVLQEIRKATVGPDLPEGVPIYYDPGTIGRPGQTVTIDLKDVKLKTGLRLMLAQVGMTYAVNEGLLIIARPDSPEIPHSGTGGFR